MRRFRDYYQKWRNRVDSPRLSDQGNSNFSVPLTQWHVFGRWSQEMQRLLGDDSEVVAKPVGPSDYKIVRKVGRFMSWRLFDSMRITTPLSIFTFRKILFGRSFAYRPWVREMYRTPQGPAVKYEGPGFFPVWPDDLVMPAEDVDNIQEFSWVIRKVRVTPQQLLDGERDGRYFGISDNFEDLVKSAQTGIGERDWNDGSDIIKDEKDQSEGVIYSNGMSSKGRLLMLEWYGKWRLPKGKQDASEFNLDRRQMDQSEIVVRFIPVLQKVVSVQDLMTLYPHMKNRRPFSEASLVKDGTYWCAGFGELLESIEDEATSNHRLFTDAGRFTVGPLIFYRPGAGFNPKKTTYEPFNAIPTEDPGSVKVVTMGQVGEYPVIMGQVLRGYAELVDGVSDSQLGRATDRPNAPRTASGQIALLQKGDLRADFDVMGLREDMRGIISDIWELDCEMAPASVFFRVTEEDAQGLFETSRGGATITAEERGGRFDFDIELATNSLSREIRLQKFLQLYGMLLQNPLVVQNPALMATITRTLCKELDWDEVAEAIPMPPPLDQPKTPQEEWSLILQGTEDVKVNPADNDDLHIMQHQKQLEDEKQSPADQRDTSAENEMITHIFEHQAQKKQKMLMQALTQQLVQQVSQHMQNGGGNQPGMQPQGLPGVPPGPQPQIPQGVIPQQGVPQ